MKSILPVLILLLTLTPSTLAQKTPDEALKAFTVAEGLQVELFASEPMFVNPTCIDVDHKGRVWVCESVNYRCDLRKIKRNRAEGDRLVVLEDTDGDGKADKSHTFYQEKDFIAPLGVAVMPYPDGKGQRVYVCHSPHIYVFEDKDGDLKADAAPKILLTGFKGYDHDHGVHGIHFGPDGKLYFSVGDQGVDKLSSANGNFLPKGEPGAEKASGGRKPSEERVWSTNRTDCQAATCWRCNPDGTNLELLAHNFRNPYEPAVDSFGTVFMSDNDDDGNQQTRICYVMYGGNYGYWPRNKGDHHWHEDQPGVVHKVLRTGFGSPTGMCWYEGSLLPLRRFAREPVYGYLLHTEAGPREVRCYVVKPKGAGYELDQVNLVTSTDNWFRPSDVCVAPDGSVFVSDWYDPGVGGHGMGDTTRGRIYRVTPKGLKGYKLNEPDIRTKQGLLSAWDSPNTAARQLAITTIKSLPLQQRVEAVAPGVSDGNNIRLIARACWFVFGDSEIMENPRIQISFASEFQPAGKESPEPSVRLILRALTNASGRLTNEGLDTRAGKAIVRWMGRFIGSRPHISSRRELLITLRNADPEFAKNAIMHQATHFDGQDPFYLAAINIAVGTDPKRREIILADFEKHFPEWNDRVAKLVWELRPPAVIAKLDQKLADPKLTAAQKGQVLDILAVSDAATGGQAVLKLLANPQTPKELRDQAWKSLTTHLPGRWAALKPDLELTRLLDQWLLGPDQENRRRGVELVGLAERKNLGYVLPSVAESPLEDPPVRVAAIRSMIALRPEKAVESLTRLIDDKDLHKEAIAALGKMESAESLAPLKKLLVDPSTPADLRTEALAAVAGSRPGTIWLLVAQGKQELPEALLPDIARLLRNSPYQDLRNRALVAFPAPGKLDPKKLPSIATLANRLGDPHHGREIFLKNKDLGCVRCHSIRGAGGNIGPDLSMIGKKGSRENLFESLLDPDKAVADQYVQWIVLDDKGVTLTGLVVEDNAAGLIIRDANGKDTKVPAANLDAKKKSPKSIMPSDLVAFMTDQDLVDMVAYLETLKTPALAVDQWHILGPFDNGANDAGLDKEHIAERKLSVDLAASHDGKHGKITWRTVKPNAESYVDLASFFAPQSKEIVSYLYREIESPAEQEATILLGADDGCKLWLNGEQVLSHRRHEAATPERDAVKVKLKKGGNSVLLKINNGDGPHGFYFTVLSEQELKPQGK